MASGTMSAALGIMPAGAKIPAPWAVADLSSYYPCDGRKIASAACAASVYAGLGFSMTQTPHVDANVTGAAANHYAKGGSLYVTMIDGSTSARTTTDGITWTARAIASATHYDLGYDATNALFIANNNSAGTIGIDTMPAAGGAWTARDPGATTTPVTSLKGMAISSGGVTLNLLTGTTNISKATNGTTYSLVTAPFTLSNSSLIARLDAAALFMLYDSTVSTTTYYTSAAGSTGTWTSRTLPFVPVNSTTACMVRAAGKIWFFESATDNASAAIGRLAYTTDCINWTTVQPEFPISNIRGGYPTARQAAHDAGEPYLLVLFARGTATSRDGNVQEQMNPYYTTDGVTYLAVPWTYWSGTAGVDALWSGVFLSATAGIMPSSSYAKIFAIDASTKSLPFHDSHIIKVL